MIILELAAVVSAGIPALLFVRNLRLYRNPPFSSPAAGVSVLIPARNEESSIEACVRHVFESRGVDFEVIVLDDRSTDSTPWILDRLRREYKVLRVAEGEALPQGWCGKQFACRQLSELATHPILCFLDSDVRVKPDGLARCVAALDVSGAALVSGFPCQETCSVVEDVVLLMHFLLLGFLPLARMRKSAHPAYAAGCGQLMIVDAAAYRRAGGHAEIRATRHDGIQLPAALRRAGFGTDLFDMTDVATCRMYRSASEVWNGLLKNATEGLGAPKRIVPATLLLLAGQAVPFVLLPFARSWWFFIAAAMALLPRLLCMWRFRHPLRAAVLHPFSVLVVLAVQWCALIRFWTGMPVTWKGREYPERVIN